LEWKFGKVVENAKKINKRNRKRRIGQGLGSASLVRKVEKPRSNGARGERLRETAVRYWGGKRTFVK